MNIRKKCVVVGDEEAGKIELLVTYTTDKYPEVYVPTYFGAYVADVMIGGKTYELALWDTSKQEGYDRLRPLSYPDTDVFVMCFSIASPDSFENVREKWYPEVTHHCPKTPIVLVGTHLEFREDEETLERLRRQHQTPISYRQGLRLQKKIGAVKYVDCSIRNLENVKKVFNDAALAAVKGHKPFASICPICKKKIKAFCQEAIFCEGACDTRIHRKCALLSKSEFKKIFLADEPFHCPRCRHSLEQQDTEMPQPSSNNDVAHNTTSTAGVGKAVREVLMQPFHKIASIPRLLKTSTTTTTAVAAPSSDCESLTAEQSSGEQTVLNDSGGVLDTVPTIATFYCFKYTDTRGATQRIRIIDKIAPRWRRFGACLKFSTDSLDIIELNNHHKVDVCTERLLSLWLEGHVQEDSRAPITWRTFLEALRDANLVQLADNLTHLLPTIHND